MKTTRKKKTKKTSIKMYTERKKKDKNKTKAKTT